MGDTANYMKRRYAQALSSEYIKYVAIRALGKTERERKMLDLRTDPMGFVVAYGLDEEK